MGSGTRVFAERAKILTLVAYERAQRALRGVCEPIAAPCGTATVFERTSSAAKRKKSNPRMWIALLCIEATKKIFFAFCIKVSNSNGVVL